MKLNIILVICVFFLSACSTTSNIAKKIWGTSITHLEQARVDAYRQNFKCDIVECYQALLDFVPKEVTVKPEEVAHQRQYVDIDQDRDEYRAFINRDYYIYQDVPEKGVVVFMGIPGAVDTTEVGVFLFPSGVSTGVEIVSYSKRAKRRAAKDLYAYLEENFAIVGERLSIR